METLSRLVLTFLLNALWQVALLAWVGAVCHHLMRRSPARYRHVVWVMVLAVSVVLPIESVWTGWSASEFPTLVTATDQRGSIWSSPPQAKEDRMLFQNGPATQEERGISNPFTRGVDILQERTRSIHITPLLAWIVLACYAISLAYHARRLWRAWGKTKEIASRTHTREIPAALGLSSKQCRDSLGLPAVPIFASAEITGPITLGARKPVIILPENLFLEASEAEATSVFAHEMAHILRRDFLMNVIYELVSLPVSFHPAMTLIKRRMNETRELACDEIATSHLKSPPDYARTLVALARRMSAGPEPSRSGYSLGIFDANILEERVMAILDQKSRVASRLAKATLAAGVFLLAASCIFASAFTLNVSQAETARSDDALNPFVGKWQAKLMGKPYVTLALNIADHRPVGNVTFYHVVLDDNGHPADVREEPSVCSVTDAKVEGKNLTLSGDCPGGNVMEFAMNLTGENDLNLKVLGVPAPPEESGGLKLTKEADSEYPGALWAFAGTWEAIFNGKPFTTLKLVRDGDKLMGTMSPCRIMLDGEGRLTKAERSEHGTGWKIVETKFDGAKLSIKAQEDDSEDIDHFEMKLTGDGNQAKFKPVGSPMPVEPWKMVRETGHPTGGIVAPPLSGIVASAPLLASLNEDVRQVLAGRSLKGLDFAATAEQGKKQMSETAKPPQEPRKDIIEQIMIRGDHRIQPSTLGARIATHVGDVYDEKSVDHDLKAFSKATPKDDVRVEVSSGERGKIITFFVREKKQTETYK